MGLGMTPEILHHDTPARWYCPCRGGWVLIRLMDDDHILNSIRLLINRKGHIHKKLPALVAEACRRGLAVPDHKWVRAFMPEGYHPVGYCPIPGEDYTDIYNPANRD